jgi:hypothetical protein
MGIWKTCICQRHARIGVVCFSYTALDLFDDAQQAYLQMNQFFVSVPGIRPVPADVIGKTASSRNVKYLVAPGLPEQFGSCFYRP